MAMATRCWLCNIRAVTLTRSHLLGQAARDAKWHMMGIRMTLTGSTLVNLSNNCLVFLQNSASHHTLIPTPV